MLFAFKDGEKIEATPKTRGECILCSREVFSKCGEINVWHWAHQKDESCDSWYEPETFWHKNWKLLFGKEYCEIVISKDGVKHIADIQTKDCVIIELQNSPIQKQIIRRRETFYGEKMLWVINGCHFKDNFRIYPSSIYNDEVYYRQYLHSHNHTNSQKTPSISQDKFSFSWDWPRKSWGDVQRNIFIDFGDENLFWVKQGMGTKCGSGKQIKKVDFLKKYGGDTNLLSTIIEKPRS